MSNPSVDSKLILEVKNLRTYFHSREGTIKAVNDVSFDVFTKKTLGIVGESGCGKSVTSQSILRLVPSNGRIESGNILLHTDDKVVDLVDLNADGKEMRSIRGRVISMVFQEPMTSFSPVITVGKQISEVIKLHQHCSSDEARQKTIDILREVGMPKPEQQIDSYPFNLSGGMRQRAMIAMALSCQPKIVIADEPTSALDVTIQAQILRLMKKLQSEHHMAVIIITHDLGVIAETADDVMVMYLGENVEHGSVMQVFTDPRHPYTQGLLASVPKVGSRSQEMLVPIEGSVPSFRERPEGCPFHPRCPQSIAGLCDIKPAPMATFGENHSARCHLYTDGGPVHGE